jgi:arylsulfatase A-like enzyme
MGGNYNRRPSDTRSSGRMVAIMRATVCIALTISLALLSSSCDGNRDQRSAKANVIWILLDTLRADSLHCYGYERNTSPNIDALASRGVLFESNFAQGTWTAESVSTYMTGRYFPAQYINLAQLREVRLPAKGEYLLPEIFRENGYTTMMITMADAWFSGQSRLVRGFDEFIGVEAKNPAKVSFEELNEEIFSYLDRQHGQPFFLYIHAWDPHFPHDPRPPYDRWIDPTYDGSQIEQGNRFGARHLERSGFSKRDQEYLRALYDGSVLYADHQFGLLIKRIKGLKLLDSTLIILSADHGETLGEDGKTVAHAGAKTFDEVTQVPLIMAGPGVPAGHRVDCITESVDIVPSIIDLLNLKSRAKPDGRSLYPLMFGSSAEPPDNNALTIFSGGRDYSLRGKSFRYERRQSKEYLYPVPDRVATRRDVLAEHPAVAKVMRDKLQTRLLQLTDSSSPGPVIAILFNLREVFRGDQECMNAMGVTLAGEGEEPHSCGSTDNKWLLYYDQLYSASFSENVPPLKLRTPVENGRYKVLVEILCDKAYSAYPASSLKVLVEYELEFKKVACDSTNSAAKRNVFIEIGEYEIRDGYFDATIKEGDKTSWATFSRFALVVDSEEALAGFAHVFGEKPMTREDEIKTIERLKVLGYL